MIWHHTRRLPVQTACRYDLWLPRYRGAPKTPIITLWEQKHGVTFWHVAREPEFSWVTHPPSLVREECPVPKWPHLAKSIEPFELVQ